MRVRDEDEFEEDDDLDEFEDEDDIPNLGPDDRDRDLMDGSWEAEHYSGRRRTRDWSSITAGVALLIVIALVLPMLLVFFD